MRQIVIGPAAVAFLDRFYHAQGQPARLAARWIRTCPSCGFHIEKEDPFDPWVCEHCGWKTVNGQSSMVNGGEVER